MVSESFYTSQISGKKFPWVNGSSIDFTNRPIIPLFPNSSLETSTFSGPVNLATEFGAVGVGLVPMIMSGIPYLIQALVVRKLPFVLAYCRHKTIEAILNLNILAEVPLQFYEEREGWTRSSIPNVTRKTANVDVCPDGVLRVYVDGCCLSNGMEGATAGIGVYFGHQSIYNVAVPLSEIDVTRSIDGYVRNKPTNQRAELWAAIRGLETSFRLIQYHGYIGVIKKIVVLSDSQYVVGGINIWAPVWESQQWMRIKPAKKMVANRDLWERLLGLFREGNMASSGYKVEVVWVSREENVDADALARVGASLSRDRPFLREGAQEESLAEYKAAMRFGRVAAGGRAAEDRVVDMRDARYDLLGLPGGFGVRVVSKLL